VAIMSNAADEEGRVRLRVSTSYHAHVRGRGEGEGTLTSGWEEQRSCEVAEEGPWGEGRAASACPCTWQALVEPPCPC
jgi:hypothetical protein